MDCTAFYYVRAPGTCLASVVAVAFLQTTRSSSKPPLSVSVSAVEVYRRHEPSADVSSDVGALGVVLLIAHGDRYNLIACWGNVYGR